MDALSFNKGSPRPQTIVEEHADLQGESELPAHGPFYYRQPQKQACRLRPSIDPSPPQTPPLYRLLPCVDPEAHPLEYQFNF